MTTLQKTYMISKKPFMLKAMTDNPKNQEFFDKLLAKNEEVFKNITWGADVPRDFSYVGKVPGVDYFHIFFNEELIGYFGIVHDLSCGMTTVTELWLDDKYITSTYFKPLCSFLRLQMVEAGCKCFQLDSLDSSKINRLVKALKLVTVSRTIIGHVEE